MGLNANDIETDEGRIRKLILIAEIKINEQNNEQIYYIKQKLRQKFYKI